MNYSIKAAAVSTGVSESSLRTWERRYGVPSPSRATNGRRLYSEDDLNVIRRMRALVQAGVPPAEASVAAQSEATMPARSLPSPALADHPLVTAICQASLEYDEKATVRAIHTAVEEGDLALAFDQVLVPSLRTLGDLWVDGDIVSANEHFTSEIIKREIAVVAQAASQRAQWGIPVVLACPESERHEIGLMALNILLRQRGTTTLYLGADVPTVDLQLAMQNSAADAVCLTATTESGLSSLRRATRTLVKSGITKRIFVGGPALHQETTEVERAAGILLPHSLGAAADLISSEMEVGNAN